MSREVFLDVSDLPAPEPLEKSVAGLQALKPGQYLRIYHRMEPRLLYSFFEQEDFAYEIFRVELGVYVLAWHSDDVEGARAAHDWLKGK